MKFLIPGGAGYIGSHMVRHAQELGHEVVVLDDFSTGNKWAVKDCEILSVNLLDQYKLSKLLKGRIFDGVIHFAAKSIVSDSIKNPYYYYNNNVVGTLNLVNEMLKNEINNLVFSSSAAIFGNPVRDKIAEDHPKNPVNPYGKSKLMIENLLEDISLTNDINVVCFRYFNAAGAHESGKIGEFREPETHLLPNILKSVESKEFNLKVYGNDYSTSDGTCYRDYLHVSDITEAHLLGIEYLKQNKGFSAFNLGNSKGFSVLEIIKRCEYITNVAIPFKIVGRRKGDPDKLVADNRLAIKILEWNPKFSDINNIIESAWAWEKERVLKFKKTSS